jgi:two-component system, NtrC family, sensor histidine kinase HydH
MFDPMNRRLFFSYRLFVWLLLIIALIMGGGYLIIAYAYNLQKDTEQQIDIARHNVNVAREMEIELVRLRGFTLTYLVDKSKQWHDSIKNREIRFIIYLEQARSNATNPEEVALIQQISALFANYEQGINTASLLVKRYQYSKADAILVHAAKDLLDTIHEKSRAFINLNRQAENIYEHNISQANTIILRAMTALGIGGIFAGLLLGWIISRMVFSPINQLILQVRGASGGAYLEKLELPNHGDLEELGNRIRELIYRINKAQEDLDKNKQLLQYSNKYAVLGKVAPTVAHEIRNPLAAIKMLAYSMKDRSDFPESLKPDLEIISSEIDRMDGFIRNFLRFAKPPEPIFVDLDPVMVLKEVINLLRPKINKSQISLVDKTNHYPNLVSADSGHLKQLFMNLLINAIEVMSQGGELILFTEIYCNPDHKEELNKKPYLKIIIQDSGPGIPDKILKNMFEPFIKGNEQGIGLGLSISQNIASIHKGWIEGYNNHDKEGAIFCVFLPLNNHK